MNRLRGAAFALPLALIGAAIGWIAWTAVSPWAVLLLLTLPIVWAACPTRIQAGSLYVGYLLAGTHDIPAILTAFFPAVSVGLGYLLWLVLACVLALPWICLWRPHMTAWQAAWRCLAAVTLVTLPPLGFIGWLSPLAVAGQLFPGWGFAGAALGLSTLALLAAAARLALDRSFAPLSGIPVLILAVAWSANVVTLPTDLPAGWRGLDTHLGRYPDDLPGRLAWHAQLIAAVDREIATRPPGLLVLPEEILGVKDSMVSSAWSEVALRAHRAGIVVLAGVDLPLEDGHYLDSLWRLGDGPPVFAMARVPMPLGQWHPWRTPSSPMHIVLGQTHTIEGLRVGVSFCYEDFLFWVQALTMLGQRPDVLISVANNWFDPGADAQRIQARHIELWARLWGLPLIRATNWGYDGV